MELVSPTIEEMTAPPRVENPQYARLEAKLEALLDRMAGVEISYVPGSEAYELWMSHYEAEVERTREELVGQRFMPLIPQDDHPAVERHFELLGAGNPVATH